MVVRVMPETDHLLLSIYLSLFYLSFFTGTWSALPDPSVLMNQIPTLSSRGKDLSPASDYQTFCKILKFATT